MAKSLFNRSAAPAVLTPVLGVPSSPIERFFKDYAGKPANVPDAELFQLVSDCHKAFRWEDKPLVPDNLYDPLEARLLKLDPEAMHKIEAAMTLEVFREKNTLPHEMSGITQLNDVEADAETTDYLIGEYLAKCGAEYVALGHKLDGNSVMLHYREGKLRQGFSKHTGDEGLDITRQVLNMPTVPKRISRMGDVFVRGEAICPIQAFLDRWAESTGAGEYANPRNFVSGKMGSKTPHLEALADIDFVAYTLCDSTDSTTEQLDQLYALGFEVVTSQQIETDLLGKQFLDTYLEEIKAPGYSIYELDGLVLDPVLPVHDESLRRKYKIISETATTEVVGIEYNLHKNGHFRPVALLKPVQLNGVTVSRASAFNAYYVVNGRLLGEDWKPLHPLGVGAIVTIIRSGDVIPDIQSVDVPAPNGATLPDAEFWGGFEWEESNGEGFGWKDETGVWRTPHLITTDPNHPVVRFRNIAYFFNKIGVEGFKGSSIQKVLDWNPDIDVKGICAMTVEDFRAAGFGETQAPQHVEAIAYCLDGIYLPRYMAATNFFKGYGVERMEKLYRYYEGEFLDWTGYKDHEIATEIAALEDFGTITGIAFAKGIHRFNEFAATMTELVTIEPYELPPELASTKLEGWAVVFTGFRDEELEGLLIANGGELASWSNPKIIVAKDKTKMRPKITAAIDKGAEIMSKAEFIAKLHAAGVEQE